MGAGTGQAMARIIMARRRAEVVGEAILILTNLNSDLRA